MVQSPPAALELPSSWRYGSPSEPHYGLQLFRTFRPTYTAWFQCSALTPAGASRKWKSSNFHQIATSWTWSFVPGSGATWKQSNLSWKEAPGTWNDYRPSALFEPLRKLLGAQVDAQHLDSAAKDGCSVFLTSDKTDIWSKRDAIQALANIRVLHMPSELAILRQLAG